MNAKDLAASCHGKRQFRSFVVARRFVAKYPDARDPMVVYHCQQCNRFHVGSHPGKATKRPRPPIIEDEGVDP